MTIRFVAILLIFSPVPQNLRAGETLVPFIKITSDRASFELHAGLRATHAGSRAMHALVSRFGDVGVQPGRNYAEVLQQVKGINERERLSAGAWFRGSLESGGAVRLALVFLDATSHPLSVADKQITPSSTRWQRLQLEAISPPGTYTVEISIQVRALGYTSIDDVVLFGHGKSNLLANPGYEQGWTGWHQGVSPENVGMLWVNDTRFLPWGLNYDRTILAGKDLILEEAPIEKIDRDFREARRIGANAVRLFLQTSRFMPRFMEIDESMMAFLDQVVLRASKYNLRIDLTGLSHIDSAAFPTWYNERSDEEVLAAERHFWEIIARRYADEPTIFLFDLQNEPVISGKDGRLKPVGCFNMKADRMFCYVNPHFREISAGWARWVHQSYTKETELKKAWGDYPAVGENWPAPNIPNANSAYQRRLDFLMFRGALAAKWTKTLVEAIHKYDKRHLLTIGLLPNAAPVFGGGSPGFVIPEVAEFLDVIAIHLYPDRPAPKETFLDVNKDRLEMVLRYASAFGKPAIVEEWFPLWPPNSTSATGADWFQRFLEASITNTSGWFTFYHALLVDGAETKQPFPNDQIRLFHKNQASIQTRTLTRAPGTAKLRIDPYRLWLEPDGIKQIFEEYQRLRRAGSQVDFDR